MEPIDYRKKHRRCRYCEYCYTTVSPEPWSRIFWKCKVKDKTIDIDLLFCGRGMFCKVFKASDL